ncbi:MAG TPA: hypothetical protein VND90_10000 [Terracidiphilus sp.]|nr:hypothetical protein [Terracidiphilus sp.]
MSELENPPRTYSGAFLAMLAIAVLAALGALVWTYTLSSRLAHQEAAMAEANQQSAKMQADLRETNARLRVATDELGKSLGLTQKEMNTRAQQIITRENANAKRLEAAQQQTAQQVNQVASDVTNVKTDVGGVRTDLGKTQTQVATALSQLQSMKGDMGQQSGLIARNQGELELLKHRGDRSYYEFHLQKGRKTPVGTVSLELRKADPKHSRFTLDVFADDRRYEKKNRNEDEPLQFYSGKDPALYEIVVNAINSKHEVSGYLSTPKNAPAPAGTP